LAPQFGPESFPQSSFFTTVQHWTPRHFHDQEQSGYFQPGMNGCQKSGKTNSGFLAIALDLPVRRISTLAVAEFRNLPAPTSRPPKLPEYHFRVLDMQFNHQHTSSPIHVDIEPARLRRMHLRSPQGDNARNWLSNTHK
jgi:hypothetical protein